MGESVVQYLYWFTVYGQKYVHPNLRTIERLMWDVAPIYSSNSSQPVAQAASWRGSTYHWLC